MQLTEKKLLPLWIIALFLLGYLIHIENRFFIWLTCSLLLYMVIDPWYLRLRRKKLSAPLAAAITVVVATAISAFIISVVLYMSTDAYQELESSKNIFFEYYNYLAESFKEFMSNVTSLNPSSAANVAKEALSTKAVQKVQIVDNSPLSASMGTTILSGFGSVMGILVYVFMWPVLTFFILSERDFLASKFKKLFKDEYSAETAWVKIVNAANAYFFGNFILLAITIPLFMFLFLFFPINNFMTLAILAAVINIVPFIGAVLTGALPALQVLGESRNPFLALWIYILCLTLHFLLANFVTPKILGSKVNLNATVSTLALMVWSLMWGGMGLLLAIPITAMIKILLESSSQTHLRWIASLMDNPRE